MNYYLKTTKKSTLIGGISLLLFFLFATTFLFPLFKKTNLNYETVFYFSRLVTWVCLLLIYLYSIYIEKQPFLLWKEQHYSFPFYLKSIAKTMLVLIAALFIVSIALQAIDSKIESERMNEIMHFFKNNIPLIVFTSITAGITEELLFRGYLIPRLEIIIKNTHFSILISSILFGLIHFAYGTLIQIIGPFTIGLVFALHYQKYRNIKILIACHFLWDLISLLVKTSQIQ